MKIICTKSVSKYGKKQMINFKRQVQMSRNINSSNVPLQTDYVLVSNKSILGDQNICIRVGTY